MEVRKVQITGGSTYTVSLPKEWATETGIEPGNELAFYPDGDTLIAASPSVANEARTTLVIEDASLQKLKSQIVTLYINGFDEIALEADRIATDQRRVIRSTARTLTGFEVSTETETRIVLQDFLDTSELSIHDTVMQMRLLSLSMLEDATEALFKERPGTAEEISERDDEVDRLWYVTSRLFRSVLRDPRVAASTDLGNESYFDYRTCARQIERIADHTVKIASHSDELEQLPENIREPLAALENESREIVENAMDAFLVEDSDRAIEIATATIAQAEGMDTQTKVIDERLRTVESTDAQLLGLTIDSLSRIGDYGANIAETALQKAAPKPVSQ